MPTKAIDGVHRGSDLFMIHPDLLFPNPRGNYRALGDLEGFKAVMRLKGVEGIPPLDIRMLDGQRTIIDGHRRWTAAKAVMAEGVAIKGLPCRILTAKNCTARTEADFLALSMRANMGLNATPLEEARGFQTLIATYGWTEDQIATDIGMSLATVKNRLRLLNADAALLDAAAAGDVTPTEVIAAVRTAAKEGISQRAAVATNRARKVEKAAIMKEATKIATRRDVPSLDPPDAFNGVLTPEARLEHALSTMTLEEVIESLFLLYGKDAVEHAVTYALHLETR